MGWFEENFVGGVVFLCWLMRVELFEIEFNKLFVVVNNEMSSRLGFWEFGVVWDFSVVYFIVISFGEMEFLGFGKCFVFDSSGFLC